MAYIGHPELNSCFFTILSQLTVEMFFDCDGHRVRGLTVLKITSQQEKIRATAIKYVKEAYRASMNTRVPSLRTEICPCVTKTLGVPCYPDKLQSCFRPEIDGPGSLMKRICRASGVRYPSERIALVKEAIKCRQEKAQERAKKEKLRCGAEPAGTDAQETNRQPTCLEDLRRSIEIEKDQR